MKIKVYDCAKYIGITNESFTYDKKYRGKFLVTRYGILLFSPKCEACFQSGLGNWVFDDKDLRE